MLGPQIEENKEENIVVLSAINIVSNIDNKTRSSGDTSSLTTKIALRNNTPLPSKRKVIHSFY